MLKDDRGVTVRLTARPARIVALSPHLAEIVFTAGAASQLAAVVRHSDYPAAVRKLPQVGDASRVDRERVIAIGPDLVLAWKSGNPVHDVERLERLGIPVFVTEPRRLTDIARLIRTTGVLAGTESEAERAAAALERELASLRARYGGARPVRVFYEIWHRPLLTVNGEHLISDVLALCGGVNVFAGAPVLTPSVSLEAVLAARPHVILGGSSAMRPGELESEWRAVRVAAIRTLPVRHVPPDLIQRQTTRIVQGARAVCEHLDAIRSLYGARPSK
ncbi:MAG TPA: helical backbone metal receptor [Burkholderiales bacterium]|nr:helical backbone metal receptor [Burkholderiales bacterium]